MASIAIIGAGCSGLSAAHTLRDAGHTVVLYEKSYGVGGRATTRKSAGFIYDHGAQYIKEGSPKSMSLVTERFYNPDLIDISKPIWTFNGKGEIQEGDPQQNAEHKWSYRSGLVTLAKRMAEGLDIRLETHIKYVRHTSNTWTLFDTKGQESGTYEKLLITIPATQANDLIQASQLEESQLQTQISTHLQEARYNPLLSIMLGYQTRPSVRPYYALVNTDKAHAISWLAWEHEKAPERVPAGTGLLIAQMAPQYSWEHFEADNAEILRDVAEQVSTLLQEPLSQPFFSDIQRWRYALPAAKVAAQTLNELTLPTGLAFCGDAFVGGRIYLALENGIEIAQQML